MSSGEPLLEHRIINPLKFNTCPRLRLETMRIGTIIRLPWEHLRHVECSHKYERCRNKVAPFVQQMKQFRRFRYTHHSARS